MEDGAKQWLNQIPPDVFTGKPLKYKCENIGCLVYSVGLNGTDDNGSDGPSMYQGDVVIRMK